MDSIKVVIDREQNFISIQNNGRGIPITEHKEENCYVPELIFGHLLTSSNYNDDEKKVVGGRNGYGAKLCNIFSTEFIVETADKERKLKYKQTFTNNMSVTGKPKITANGAGQQYTRISFKPDLAKFNMTEMDADFEALIKKRVYDMAGCVEGVSVSLNGTKIPVKGFFKYCELYTKSMEIRNAEGKKQIINETASNDRWQVAFAVSDGQFNQVKYITLIHALFTSNLLFIRFPLSTVFVQLKVVLTLIILQIKLSRLSFLKFKRRPTTRTSNLSKSRVT